CRTFSSSASSPTFFYSLSLHDALPILALLPFLISCLIWLDLVASLPLIKERILVIILLLHFLSLMLGSVLVQDNHEYPFLYQRQIGRAVQQECRDRSRMPSSA